MKKIEYSTLQLRFKPSQLNQVHSHKLLGVTIDSQLSFDQHVDDLCKRLAQRIAVLRKIRRSLPLDRRKSYDNAMIKQTMLYASTVWTSCSVENIKKVFRLQKHAARVILGTDTKANSVKLFKQLLVGFHFIMTEARINKSVLAYKRIFGECPPYLTQMLVRNVDVNGRSSKHGHLNLICARFNRETEGGRSFSVSTSRLWNMLPAHIKNQSTLTSLKN